jgi:hypothetical protein
MAAALLRKAALGRAALDKSGCGGPLPGPQPPRASQPQEEHLVKQCASATVEADRELFAGR